MEAGERGEEAEQPRHEQKSRRSPGRRHELEEDELTQVFESFTC